MAKFLGWVLAVLLMTLLFMNIDNGTQARIDPYIVGLIGGAQLAVGIIMLAFTRDWSARSLGLVSMVLGIAELYLGLLLMSVAPGTASWRAPITDVARALLLVGGVLLVIGIINYGRERWQARLDVTDFRDEPEQEG